MHTGSLQPTELQSYRLQIYRSQPATSYEATTHANAFTDTLTWADCLARSQASAAGPSLIGVTDPRLPGTAFENAARPLCTTHDPLKKSHGSGVGAGGQWPAPAYCRRHVAQQARTDDAGIIVDSAHCLRFRSAHSEARRYKAKCDRDVANRLASQAVLSP